MTAVDRAERVELGLRPGREGGRLAPYLDAKDFSARGGSASGGIPAILYRR